MNFEFNKTTKEFLNIITKSAQIQKMRVFFVGGIVRDNILNIKNDDIDLLIEGNAVDFSKNLPESIEIKSIHKDFNTVKLKYKNLDIDLASTRVENYPYSGCLPVVTKTGVEIENDYKRRDFSVNSLYCEITTADNELNYRLIDMVSGVSDIKTRTLRVLHDKSYIDDPTRILRGLNFSLRFGFDFSDYDKKLIENYLNSIDKENYSYDRIFSVLYKNLSSDFSLKYFREFIKRGYYKILFDEITIDEKNLEKTIEIYNLKNTDLADFLINVLEDKTIDYNSSKTPIEVYNTFSKFKMPILAYLYYKTGDENIIFYNKIKDIKLLINGDDLIEMGYKKGKLFKTILDETLNQKILKPDNFKTKNDEKSWILSRFPREQNS